MNEPIMDLEEFREKLRLAEEATLDPEPEPEPEPIRVEEARVSGRLVVDFTHSVLERDEKNRISAIVNDTSIRIIRRNEHGAIVAIDEVIEREELE